jgi:hypothetical protein
MAGDWIPLRKDLWDSPEVVRILSAMCPQNVRNAADKMRRKCEVIGALFKTWSIFDTFSDDGTLVGYDAESLNEVVGIENWAQNLQHVGWLVVREDSLEMPRFTTYLSKSAKRRMKDAERKKTVRKVSAKCPQNVRNDADKMRTTEEKRREENSRDTKVSLADGFEVWWSHYPKKASKDSARKAYTQALRRLNAETEVAAATLLEASLPRFAELRKREPQYVPHAASWLNGGCWDDEIASIAPKATAGALVGPGQVYDPNADFGSDF